MLNIGAGRSGRGQIFDIERLADDLQRAARIARPFLFWSIPVEFDAVAVGIAEIKGLRTAVVAGVGELYCGGAEAAECAAERGSRRIAKCCWSIARSMLRSGGVSEKLRMQPCRTP
ncbi:MULTISPECIES: hypothetical protein [unclassified Bradyrhizobium]|uniref:hypothetical protein n=1 Tax=unclassified Bradyrhizobium TaxID=2631580 RepID=UPI0015CE3D39|nr:MULTISPECIES: hypothetical protein [unclassified Bradyrhizobium]MBB4256021.1 hypothetical protein [Bradyrhizobium sp. CIR3A]NYG48189.1 hypothetical protein [Bradyrhizobium sp. IAR9]